MEFPSYQGNTSGMRMVQPHVLDRVGLRCKGLNWWNEECNNVRTFSMEIAVEYQKACDVLANVI